MGDGQGIAQNRKGLYSSFYKHYVAIMKVPSVKEVRQDRLIYPELACLKGYSDKQLVDKVRATITTDKKEKRKN